MDVMTRLERAITLPQWIMTEGWFPTQLLGFFAARRNCREGSLALIHSANGKRFRHSLYTQASGSRQMAVDEATDLRAMQAGFSGQGGILAAELAKRGVIGSKDVIEGRYGLYRTYVRDEGPNWSELVGQLGQHFPILESHGFKIWPCCSHIRPCVAALLQLREEGIRPEDVQSIAVIGGSKAIQSLSEPIEPKRRPQVSIDAKYSVPFTCAVAMVNGGVALPDYQEEGLKNAEVLEMAARVEYRQAADEQSDSLEPIIEIRTKDGAVRERQVTSVPGDVREPIGWTEVVEKFRTCISVVSPPIPSAKIDHVVELAANLEDLEDVTEIIRQLSA